MKPEQLKQTAREFSIEHGIPKRTERPLTRLLSDTFNAGVGEVAGAIDRIVERHRKCDLSNALDCTAPTIYALAAHEYEILAGLARSLKLPQPTNEQENNNNE